MQGRSSQTCPARPHGAQGGQLFAQHGADGLAQTADDIVLLGGDDLAALLCSLEDDLLVQRLMVWMLMTRAWMPRQPAVPRQCGLR